MRYKSRCFVFYPIINCHVTISLWLESLIKVHGGYTLASDSALIKLNKVEFIRYYDDIFWLFFSHLVIDF